MCLIRSIEKFCPDAKLYAFALDDISYQILKKLEFTSVAILRLDDLMTRELQEARLNRTEREFIWTLTPFCISKVLERREVQSVTYIDADLVFLKEPSKILDFQSSNIGKIILTPHYFEKKKESNVKKHGYYCVQYMNFNKDAHLDILLYWQTQVLESCSEIAIDGVFGDQKYIEQIGQLYPELVIDYPDNSAFGAPWNMNDIVTKEVEIFHFHSFAFWGRVNLKFLIILTRLIRNPL